jgi:ABC-type multidrug transport system fused ATPase/permease subunit
MEQVSPICRFGILKDFYDRDNSSCGRISFLYWFAAWVAIVISWIVMAGWCFLWATSNGTAGIISLAVTFAVLFLVDNVLNEMCQIYFLNVIVTDKLRPQLQQIYDVLAQILETRWSHDYFQSTDIRVIQHLSPACRAARVPSLNDLAASKLLGLVDDKDIVLCRSKRLTTWKEVGFFSYLTLFLPSFIHDGNEIVQKTFLDLIFPVFWMFFFLANYFMYSVSLILLIVFYVIAIALIFYFTHLVKEEWWKNYIGKVSDSMDENLEIDVNKITGGVSRKESDWDKMNNISKENYEFTGFNYDMVEYDEGLVKQQYTFPNFDKKKQKQPQQGQQTPKSTSSTGQKSKRPTIMIREMQARQVSGKMAPVVSPPVVKEESSGEDSSSDEEKT